MSDAMAATGQGAQSGTDVGSGAGAQGAARGGVQGAAQGASPAAPERTLYVATGGRKLAFSFVFLILLPFYVSLAPMFFWRVSQGHWTGTSGLVVLAIAFTFIMFLVVVELMQSLRARVELGERSVKMTLPSGRGPTPILRYRTHDIPYDQIRAVETRREVYGGSVAPVLLTGARLILKDDSIVKLGYVSDANTDPCFPFPQIARQIAQRAGVPVDYKGAVRRSAQRKFLGLKQGLIPESEEPVGDYEIVVLNNRHERWVMRLVWLLVALIVVGIALDIIFPPSSGLPPALTSLTKLIAGWFTPAAP
jgi:hypothetical protein